MGMISIDFPAKSSTARPGNSRSSGSSDQAAVELDEIGRAGDSAPTSDEDRDELVAFIRANRLRDTEPSELEAAEAIADDLGAQFSSS